MVFRKKSRTAENISVFMYYLLGNGQKDKYAAHGVHGEMEGWKRRVFEERDTRRSGCPELVF